MHVVVPLQTPPGQQGCPAAPHCAQLPPWQLVPGEVQKSGPPPVMQQACPGPPHPVPPSGAAQLPDMHMPSIMLHALPLATQLPATQHDPIGEHVERPQHVWPAAPQGVGIPWWQTLPGPRSWPLATHELALQHPPLSHMLFAQHGWPGPPHAGQVPAAHAAPFEHIEPLATHRLGPLSQQPPAHVLFAQHGWPGPPHWAQTSFAQPRPAPQD